MAEALAVYGLAANIVQFIDFGCRLVSTIWNIHQQNRDRGSDLSDLEVATRRLDMILETLVVPQKSSGESPESEHSLRELSQQCRNLAAEMLHALMQVRKSAKGRKRDAVKLALRLIWKEDEIKSQQMKLEEYKHQLTLHLLATLRDQSRKSLNQQELILNQLATISEGTHEINKKVVQLTADGIGASVLNFLTAKINHENKKSWQMAFITAIYEDGEKHAERDVSGLSIPPDRRRKLQSAFISQLRYRGMEDREERIADAYEETFHWIFGDSISQEKPWSNFKDWLESDSQLYWITGKEGSGKSTLMKYICHSENSPISSKPMDIPNESTSVNKYAHGEGSKAFSGVQQARYTKFLTKWAAGSRLVTATYFFWNSGISLQMSKMGLLRSLLNQILRQCPELIPFVSPSRWESLCLFNDDPREWSKEELEHMLRSVAEKLHHVAKLCLFIDGLDEFDGEHGDLINLFRPLITNDNIKICVSSRPWVLFEDAFKHRPSLTLQDLTYSDIKHYVSSNLHKDSSFAQLRSREPIFAEQLVENVVSKATGVFLWVHLVVASLLAGMGYGDRVSDLQKRLDFLPPDLGDLYEKILQSLDPFYLEHAAQLFTLVEQSAGPPSLILLSFADEETSDFALNQPIQALSPEAILLRAETMRRRLNSRCKGLLEVQKPSINSSGVSEDTVQYLHRTVKDYVQDHEVQAKLQSALTSPFDPHLRFCAGSLAHVKGTDDSTDFLADKTFWTRVHNCLYSASKTQASNRGDTIPLLDELDRTGKVLAKKVSENTNLSFLETGRDDFMMKLLGAGQWVPFHPRFLSLDLDGKFGGTFLSLATHYGVIEYIEARAMHGCLVQQAKGKIWPLLGDAIHAYDAGLSKVFVPTVFVAMIACMLCRGADPNFLIPAEHDRTRLYTVWEEVLRLARKSSPDGIMWISPIWEDVARLMVEHRADVSQDTLISALYGSGAFVQNFVAMGEGREELKKFYDNLGEMKKATAGSWMSWLPSAKTSKAKAVGKHFTV